MQNSIFWTAHFQFEGTFSALLIFFCSYLVVFMFEEAGQGLDAGLQRRVLRLHLTAEPGHHSHGRVQSVFMHEVAAVSDEAQHAVQTTGLENSAGLPGADQLQYLREAQTSYSS